MSIQTIAASGATTGLQAKDLTQQDFLKVLLTQLTYQDPMKPMDNQQFMAQLAQFSTLQQTQQLNTNIETLIGNQSALQSVGLIGRTVDITTDSGTATGTVTQLALSGTSPIMTVKTSSGALLSNIGLSQIQNIR
jgi:flagellar basal-body rod modification protein FlgD